MGLLDTTRPKEFTEPPAHEVMLRIRLWPMLLIGGWIAQVGFRLLLAAHQKVPILIPDETGYLLAGRLLAGGAVGDLSGRTFYQAGYPLLISPAYWLSGDPGTVYQLVVAINSMVSASLLILVYVALRRLDLTRPQAYVIATLSALLPAGIYYGEFALTDAVLPVVVFGWLLLVHTWLTSGRWGYGAAASLVAAYAYCVHVRGALIVGVHAALLLIVLWRRWASGRDLAMAAGTLAGGSAASWALNSWLKSQIYPGGSLSLSKSLSERLTSLDGLGWTLGLSLGKIWYLIVSTWGVAGVGLVVLVVVAFRPDTPRAIRAVAGLTLGSVVVIAVASSAAVADEGTVANFAYGRYLSCLAPVLFMAGSVFALRCTKRTAAQAVLCTAVLALATGGAMSLYAGHRLARNLFASYDFPEICFLTWNWTSLQWLFATLAALLLLALAALVILEGRSDGLLLVAVAFIAIDLVVVPVTTHKVTRFWRQQLGSATSLAPARLVAQDQVALDYHDLPWRIWVAMAIQSRNGLTGFDRFRAATLPSGTTLVIVHWDGTTPAQRSWPAAPSNWRPVLARHSYTGDWVAWRRAS